MTTFDLEEEAGAWFEMDGGGRVQIRLISPETMKSIRKQSVKRRVEFKKVDGTPARFEHEEIDEDLQSELFWDDCIVGWQGLMDAKGREIPCTKENKLLLMNLRSGMFRTFVVSAINRLSDETAKQAAVSEKNS
jgi:hypothetical protein